MAYPGEACAAVIKGLEAAGIEYLIHVPGSFGAPVLAYFEADLTVRSSRWLSLTPMPYRY